MSVRRERRSADAAFISSPSLPHPSHTPTSLQCAHTTDYRRTVDLAYVSRGLQVAFSYVSLTILALPIVSFGAVRVSCVWQWLIVGDVCV